MAWSFGDGFDCYANGVDAANGYWDTSAANWALSASPTRFGVGRALQTSSTGVYLSKSSGQNDSVHHFVVAYYTQSAITGSTLGLYLQLLDGTTGQCAVVFRSDGTILLTSGTAAGAILATYASAFTAISTWYAFEFEVVVHNSTGSFKVRKNGNPVDDHSTTGIDTAGGTANNYANKLQVGQQAGGSQYFDDLFWRSDASSVAWLGDIRCYTRMPASDASVQFSRSGAGGNTQAIPGGGSNVSILGSQVAYSQFTPTFSGLLTLATVVATTGNSGNAKCAIFDSTGASGGPGAVLGSSAAVTPIASGTNTFTFTPGVAVSRGVPIWLGICADTSAGNYGAPNSGTYMGGRSITTYASFPVANPTLSSGPSTAIQPVNSSITINANTNVSMVSEPQQDATTSYVYDSTPGHADFYGIASIASTPVSTIAVVTRAYMQKSDAGTRTAAVQLKSGAAAAVASPTLVLTTSGWQWAWRTDLTDPNTSAAWTAAAVNNVQCGPLVVA